MSKALQRLIKIVREKCLLKLFSINIIVTIDRCMLEPGNGVLNNAGL